MTAFALKQQQAGQGSPEQKISYEAPTPVDTPAPHPSGVSFRKQLAAMGDKEVVVTNPFHRKVGGVRVFVCVSLCVRRICWYDVCMHVCLGFEIDVYKLFASLPLT